MTTSLTDGQVQCASRTESNSFRGKSVYFIGIGGCGMSGLARMARSAGAAVCGSDNVRSETTDALAAEGIDVQFSQAAGVLPHPCDLVIASAAIRPDHPECVAARNSGLPIMTYAEALGMLQSRRTGISIAGTHGKSTTTAMLAHILIQAGLEPGFVVGAHCPQIGGGSRTGADIVPGDGPFAGNPGLLIAEACEFNRSFHHHRPRMALVGNVEADHLDIYGTIDAVVEAFAEFARLLPPADEGGRLLIAHEGAHRREITAGLTCRAETFGFHPAADFRVVFDPASNVVTLRTTGRRCARWICPMPGEHNALNGAAAAIIAQWCGAAWTTIEQALTSFAGIDRRMQRLGVRPVRGGEVIVYDDYGHHPTEIDATLRALRRHERPDRLICVFQPHQHSRTRFLLDEFARSFDEADIVIVPHIYFVRDSEIEKTKVSASDLVNRLRVRGVAAMHLESFEGIVEQLEKICRSGDLVVIMGAGPVWQIGRDFVERPNARRSERFVAAGKR